MGRGPAGGGGQGEALRLLYAAGAAATAHGALLHGLVPCCLEICTLCHREISKGMR